MKFLNFAVVSLFVASVAFAQGASGQKSVRKAPVDPKASAPAPAATLPQIEITEEDMAMIRMLLNNDMFKNSFAFQCAGEASTLLGQAQAEKTCNCAYESLIKNDKLLYALATTDNDDGFDKWGFDVIEPCLPEKFTAEIETAFVNQCVAESGEEARSICSCTFKEISKKYTVKSLLKAGFENGEKLQMDLIMIAGNCAMN